jgi:hypothetical protein
MTPLATYEVTMRRFVAQFATVVPMLFLATAIPGVAQAQDEQEKPGKKEPITLKRMHKHSDEELRKQLLQVTEAGLNQEAAAGLYKFLKDSGAMDGGAAKKQQLPLDAGRQFLAKIALAMGRPDFTALPWRAALDAQMGKEPAEHLHVLSIDLRGVIRASVPAQDVRPDVEQLAEALRSGKRHGGAADGIKPDDWARSEAVPVLIQMLQVENTAVRLLMVERLAIVSGKDASIALAQRAVFDLSAEVREKAAQALVGRPLEEYKGLLLESLRYPWPAAAQHAAEVIVALKLEQLAPDLASLLKLPDTARPVPGKVNGKQDYVIRELVRINHMSNCMLCHAPSPKADDLVRGRIPVPGEDPPPLYYQERTGTFVTAQVTFLRQDFSVMQPVAVPGTWPAQQRFDYLVRERPLTDQEAKTFVRQRDDKALGMFAQREALLFALRELTQRDAGQSYADWAALLDKIAVEKK